MVEGKSRENEGSGPGAALAGTGSTEGSGSAARLNFIAYAAGGLLVFLSVYTLYFAKAVFLPLALAGVLSLLLKPITRGLKRIGIPPALSGALILIVLLVILISGIVFLSGPVEKWVSSQSVEKIEGKIRTLMRPAEKITQAAAQVQELAQLEPAKTPEVTVKSNGVLQVVISRAKGFVYLGGTTFVMLYFLLAAGDRLTCKLIEILPRWRDKKELIEIFDQIQHQIASYLWTITLINIWEGTIIGLGLALVGMPNALLWGVMAALVNYIPYLGAATGMCIVALAAFVTFDSLTAALLPPLIYLSVNVLDNFIGPLILGRRLIMNPVLVFLSLIFWGWLWGMVGVFLAVPMLMILKIWCDHIRVLQPLGEFLGETRDRARRATARPAPSPA